MIGRKIDEVLQMFLTQMPSRLEVADGDPRISGAIFDIDPRTGRALSIRRVHERLEA